MTDNQVEFIDVSDDVVVPKKDRFMTGIYISLIVLVILGLLVYLFGYELFKPFIKV